MARRRSRGGINSVLCDSGNPLWHHFADHVDRAYAQSISHEGTHKKHLCDKHSALTCVNSQLQGTGYVGCVQVSWRVFSMAVDESANLSLFRQIWLED